MIQFSVPGQTARSVFSVEEFTGVDYTNDPGAAANGRSPNGQNMIRDVPGKLRKCMGYHRLAEYPARINGRHTLLKDGVRTALIHAGTALYPETVPGQDGEAGEEAGPQPLYTGMADERSKSWQLGEKLFILDGKALLVYDGEKVCPARP